MKIFSVREDYRNRRTHAGVSIEEFMRMTRDVMNSNWIDEFDYTQPNRQSYPWMWLWDSCFNAIIYAALGDSRAVREATSIFAWQRADGMIPHMGYQRDLNLGKKQWSCDGASTITQPPMYGHTLKVLHKAGFQIESLLPKAEEGFRFLFEKRRLPTGLIGVVHPWETGADNSPRWLPWCEESLDIDSWRTIKDELVYSLEVNQHGSAIGNAKFSVASASFNALVAFNALELFDITGDEWLKSEALNLSELLEDTYDEKFDTWTDSLSDGEISSSSRTLDSLLPTLVSSRRDRVDRSLDLLVDTRAFGALYGPCGVDQREQNFDPDGYWRGVAWPQLTYLLFVSARRHCRDDVCEVLRDNAVRAAIQSGFSESINPLTGAGRGARPHSWSCLPITMF